MPPQSGVEAAPCEPTRLPAGLEIPPSDPESMSVELSRTVYRCAETVALAPADDPGAAWRAVESGGPVLLVDGELDDATVTEVRRLDPSRLVLVGLGDLDPSPLGVDDVERLALRRQPPRALGVDSGDDAWLVAPGGESILPAVTAAARSTGGAVVVAGPDVRSLDADSRSRLVAAASVGVVGGPVEPWRLAAVRRGDELPGGGLLLFPGRRLVALYGHPGTPALGLLGEQGPEAAADRAVVVAAGYDADGVPVVPAFEIIATVASASSGDDGDYSAEASVEELRPWVETAAARGVYVVLDLQPGRTDFLTQARRYEELLRLPHVGLALDPEWRLGPDQVHLRQIGSVDATEINDVSAWLAGIVREEGLPQKLLLLHQFRLSMITSRELVETPPELAVVVQMDGQGPQATKHATWGAITAGTGGVGWRWGWKNFFDEDSPLASPGEVLGLSPSPVYVSFQ